MTKAEIIEKVLRCGTVHQQYIVKRDVLGCSVSSAEMIDLQNQILQSKQVVKILKNQNEDGWIGYELHGGVGTALDSSVGCLIEDLGVESSNPAMQKAKKALLANANPDPRGKGEYNGISNRGYRFSHTAILGFLQADEIINDELKAAWNRIFEIFENSSKIQSLDEVSILSKRKKYIGHRALLPGKVLAWISDIIVLSTCLRWQSTERQNIINKCFANIARFMPIPVVFEVINGYYLAPVCGYGAFSYEDCTQLPKGEIVWWLRDFSRFCKICDVITIPYFSIQAENLKNRIANDDLISNLSESALVALEKLNPYRNRWKSEDERNLDIEFKALRLLHNAKIEF